VKKIFHLAYLKRILPGLISGESLRVGGHKSTASYPKEKMKNINAWMGNFPISMSGEI